VRDSSPTEKLSGVTIAREEASLFFRLLVRRYERASLIVTSNKSFVDWGGEELDEPARLTVAAWATKTIPIVIMALLVDPVKAGFVASFSRPGGNITGVASQYEEIGAKQMQLLTEAVPGIARLVLLRDGTNPGAGLTASGCCRRCDEARR
jgi:ABC transporter substrate binding protein/IstB-like ATP binding protein